jgi:hypothetical protein
MILFPNIFPRIRAFFLLIMHIFLIRKPTSQKPESVWLIGENRGNCIKDNGYFFFQYCRKIYPEKSVYYIINKCSPYYESLSSADSNVIIYGSSKHISIFCKATVSFYTHTYIDLLYKRHFELFGRKKKLVYLHHGVLGFKKFDCFYLNNKNIMDVFIVGNNMEKDILIENIGTNPEKIRVTGYARYDYIKNFSLPPQQQIVYIPTFRNWLLPMSKKSNNNDFLTSDFHFRIHSFLNNLDLHRLLKINNIILKFYLHEEFQQYTDLLKSTSCMVLVCPKGAESPSKLISESRLMITDYSSVAWDFFYMNKPVILYRFDKDDFANDRGSYLPLENDIIGNVVYDEYSLIQLISNSIEQNFVLPESFRHTRNKLLPNQDKNNCKRIFSEASKLEISFEDRANAYLK